MYLIKNAFRNMIRNQGRNILIGVIITVITICTCVGLSIHKAGTNLVNTYTKTNPLAVSFNLDMTTLRNASDDEKNNFQSLTIDDIKKYADSSLVKDYYYTLESGIDSNSINAVEDNKRPENDDIPNDNDDSNDLKKSEKFGNMGDFRITAYSNFAYLSDFSDGNKKITDGVMVSGSSDDKEIVISSDLASENDLEVGSEVTLCLSDDENTTFTFKVVGIYENSSSDDASNFMSMNALNSANQIYANLSSVQEILDAAGDDDSKLVASNGLTAKFYLNDNDDLDKFESDCRDKGLSDYYSVSTNEDELLQTLRPIQNISTFSFNFLIVIIVIGIVVLAVINFLNIRDRKYEIGVLRAIGMSKFKVTSQLVLEIFFVALFSLVIGTGIGTIISQPITNKMLESEISSYTEQSQNIQNNFGGGNFEKPSREMTDNNNFNKNEKNNIPSNVNNYVDSLKVKVDFITILELFGISILLTVTSGVVASVFINKYNPNKILQNRI